MFYSCRLIFRCIYTLILIHSVSSGGEKMFIVKIEVKDVYTNCAGIPMNEQAVFNSAKDIYSYCGGTILTGQVVLTAAHCIHKKKDVSVLQFTSNEINKYEVDTILVHPRFDCLTFCDDIGLIKIKTRFRKPWKPVILNDWSIRSNLNNYENCNMVGWLVNDHNTFLNIDINKSNRLDNPKTSFPYEEELFRLTRVPVKIISSGECLKKIKNFGGSFAGEEKLCGIYTEDSSNHWCSVGSGGPLICPPEIKTSKPVVYERNSVEIANNLDYERIKYVGVNETLEDPLDLLANFNYKRSVDENKEYQIAVVSWGKMCSKVPSIFIRTDDYYAWIKRSLKNFDNDTDTLYTYTMVFGTTSKSTTAVESSFLLHFSLLLIIFVSIKSS